MLASVSLGNLSNYHYSSRKLMRPTPINATYLGLTTSTLLGSNVQATVSGSQTKGHGRAPTHLSRL